MPLKASLNRSTWRRAQIAAYGSGVSGNSLVPPVRAIYQHIRWLKATPYRGRPGHRSGTRELPLTPLPYVVVYSVKPEAVEILHIHHGAQDWR